MEKNHHNKNLVGFDGASYLVPLFQQAGFEDIQVIKASVDNGDWRKGSLILLVLLTLKIKARGELLPLAHYYSVQLLLFLLLLMLLRILFQMRRSGKHMVREQWLNLRRETIKGLLICMRLGL